VRARLSRARASAEGIVSLIRWRSSRQGGGHTGNSSRMPSRPLFLTARQASARERRFIHYSPGGTRKQIAAQTLAGLLLTLPLAERREGHRCSYV
jgi:hypothetical protein